MKSTIRIFNKWDARNNCWKSTTVPRVYTAGDARKEKLRVDAMLAARDEARQARFAARQARFTVPPGLHPAIGILTTAKGLKFYAHIGPDRVYHEGTVESLTAALTEAGR